MGNNDFLKNAIKSIEDEIIEGSEENKALINFRPGANISAMLEIISALSNKPVNRILFEELRRELCDFILHHSERERIIIDSVKAVIDSEKEKNTLCFNDGSILGILHEAGCLKARTPFMIEQHRRVQELINPVRLATD